MKTGGLFCLKLLFVARKCTFRQLFEDNVIYSIQMKFVFILMK